MVKTKEINLLAQLIAKKKGRTKVICNQLSLSPTKAKKIYKEVNGESPPSGLSPDSKQHIFSSVNRMHASILMDFYEKALKRISDDIHLHHQFIQYETLLSSLSTEKELNKKRLIELKLNQIYSKEFHHSIKQNVLIERTKALISAFSLYSRICKGDVRLDINRFDYMITNIFNVSNKSHWTKCISCESKILKDWHEENIECTHCSGGLDRSKNLKQSFLDKSLSKSMQ